MTTRDPKVVVVGAGMGGLACAIELAAAGVEVTVLERALTPGGKARAIQLGDHAVDGGPTVLTMPWVFDELFAAAGESFRAAVALERADVLARHAWPDGRRLDLFADQARSAEAIGEVFGRREAEGFLAFCEDTRRIYAISEDAFIRSQRLTMPGIVKRFGAAGLGALVKLDSHRTMWQAIQSRFSTPQLRQLFGRYATYCGSSPFEAPGTLNLVAHVEAEGVYRARGGLRALVSALESTARRLGVRFRYGAHVDRIEVVGGRVTGVIGPQGHERADAVVWNGDVGALADGAAGGAVARAAIPTPVEGRSLSAVTWAMVARPEGFPLLHHNVFFSGDYGAEFEDLLRRGRAPAEPTVYVCAQDRGDDTIAPGDERLLVIVNAPPTGDTPARWSEAERERCTEAMENVLRRAGSSLSPRATVQSTPVEFHRLFPSTGGALYGPRSKGSLSFLARSGATTRLPGLYLAGGSVHPGPGVPMAAQSGRLAAARVREGLASTSRSRRAAIAGTTSMG